MAQLMAMAAQVVDTFGWGPYIILALTIMSAIAGWSVQRLLKRIDSLGHQVDELATDVALIKDRQLRRRTTKEVSK